MTIHMSCENYFFPKIIDNYSETDKFIPLYVCVILMCV